ncbi:hypothetical protein OEZ86_004096 [Tetradesmus obliquus]|nr:hypothetical protein OEZ86_004096 [Tetradesmus obliquus]
MANITITSLVVHNNTAQYQGGGISAGGASDVSIFNSSIAWNTVIQSCSLTDGGGAGICALEEAAVEIVGTAVHHNTAISPWGGGVRLLGQSTFAAANSTIQYNAARIGGGIAMEPNTSVTDLPLLLSLVTNNSATRGPQLAVDPSSMQFVGNTTFDYASRAAADEGALSLKLAFVGALGLPSPGVLAAVSLGDMQSLGANTSDDTGIVHLLLRVRKPPGRYSVSVRLPEFVNVSSANATLHVRGCVPGEVAPIPDTCEPCLPGFYTLDPAAAVCSGCPGGAECPGGAALVPLPGWWHSTATSAQMHR